MKLAHPDLVVTGPDGEYLMIVEVKLNDSHVYHQSLIEQLKKLMASLGCSLGLAVSGEQIFLLRDSLEKSDGESIEVVSQARLPDTVLPVADEQWRGKGAIEFESRVQRWLETLKLTSNLENLPSDLRKIFQEPIISLLRVGEIRAAGPRWSRVAN